MVMKMKENYPLGKRKLKVYPKPSPRLAMILSSFLKSVFVENG